ncbi:hypothetical protein [Myxococcus virescens]|uniref:Uncharacterized protein n=1 Tax=Myxococcus virescens TaxID=83456 RepID=A0A511HHJ2_9BACT|nr:hypothetical protein [Myxococcus virescens]GEL72945.1 hypothetical protein MVI01_47290 [Myxococcus virescens]SDE07125.1 hypothetical protein SAMN04488504_10451 [Myxococcus virescens]
MKLLRFALWGLVVALAFSAGVWFSRDSVTSQVPAGDAAVQAPSVVAPTPSDARAAPRPAEAPRREAAVTAPSAARDATVLRRLPEPAAAVPAAPEKDTAPEDRPLAFAPELPEPFTPKGFERVAFRAANECGMGLDVVAVDCSEFPCIAWTQAKDDTVKHFSMSGCAPWEEAFQHRTMVVASGQFKEGGAGARYLAWMPLPVDPELNRIAMRRARERTDGMKEALGLR